MVCSKETTPHRVIRLFVTGELDSSHLLCLTFDVVYACSYPEAVKRRPAVIAFHRLEGHLIAVLNAFVAVGVLTATSRADWFGDSYYFCTHITPVDAKREAPKHCSGLVTVVEPGCLLNQVCWYLIPRMGAVHNLSVRYFAPKKSLWHWQTVPGGDDTVPCQRRDRPSEIVGEDFSYESKGTLLRRHLLIPVDTGKAKRPSRTH